MSLYVDTTALVKRYVDEPESEACEAILLADSDWIYRAAHLRRASPRAHTCDERQRICAGPRCLPLRLGSLAVAELDEPTCARAAEFTLALGVRSLDALHLAAAHRIGGAALPFLTYDLRQAQAARSLGWSVLGV